MIYQFRITWKTFRNIVIPGIVYIALLFGFMPKHLSLGLSVIFLLYALFIFWIVWEYAISRTKASFSYPGERRFFIGLLFASFVFIVVSRLILFVRYGATPLGYDTGFYLNSIESTFQGLDGHRAIRSLIWVPLVWLGVPKIYILHGLYVFAQFLLAGSIYTLARSLSLRSRLAYAAILTFLFSVSLPQFFAYWWMFYQMQFALAFLIMTVALIYRRSPLALLTGIFGAAIHPATFLPLLIALTFFAISDLVWAIVKWRKVAPETIFILFLGLIALFGLRMFGQEFILVYSRGSVSQYGWFITHYPPELKQQFTGLYIDLSLFKLANIYILPFTILGILLFFTRKFVSYSKEISTFLNHRLILIAIMLGLTFTLASTPFIYHNRFLIILDLMMIVFAAFPLLYFLKALFSLRAGKMIIGLLIGGFFFYTSYAVWGQQPQLYADERAEIERIAQIAGPDEYAMSTESLYTPWVHAFSSRATIDPGYLGWNRWDYPMWREFWYGQSNARRHELLNLYNRPIYIFVGKRVPETIPYKRFIVSDAHFVRVSSHVWYYDPNQVSSQEIEAMFQVEEDILPVSDSLNVE